LIAWAVASPIGASPDDDYHLASIWCGLGERPGLCESVPGNPTARSVPYGVAETLCNRTFPEQDVRCAVPLNPAPGAMITTDRGNFTGTYPPVYYTFMSIFASPHYAASAIVMRIVNAVLFVGITSLLYFLLTPSRRRTLVWMWAIGIVPLGMFLVASNNPSAWAIISGGALWITLVGWFESRGRRALGLGILSVVLAVMGAGARADSAVYVLIAAGIAVILSANRTREFLLKAILPAAIALIGVVFYLGSQQSGIASAGLTGRHTGPALSGPALLWNNFLALPDLIAGNQGTWSLGWLDTPMPAVTWVTCIGIFGALAFAGLRSSSLRKIIALVVAIGALVAVPTWILYKSHATVGQEVQPRYIFGLLIMVAGVALLEVGTRRLSLSRLQVTIAALALTVANAAALHVELRRYLTGPSMIDLNLDRNIRWWWHVPFSPMFVWIVGGLAFGAALFFALWQVSVRSPLVDRADRTVSVATPD
jgi:hypothetical protein